MTMWLIIAAVVYVVFQAFKKAIADARKSILEDLKKAEAAAIQDVVESIAPEERPAAVMRAPEPVVRTVVDPYAVNTRSYDIKSDESRVDYDDDARENLTDYDDDASENRTDYDDDAYEIRTDYDDDARENRTDYDDDASESRTDYDDDARENRTDYDDEPLPKTVVYAMPDDSTSTAINRAILAQIESHAARVAKRPPPAHGLDARVIKSHELVRDSVVMQTLLARHPRNPFFRKR